MFLSDPVSGAWPDLSIRFAVEQLLYLLLAEQLAEQLAELLVELLAEHLVPPLAEPLVGPLEVAGPAEAGP